MKKVFILLGHPNPDSLNAALLDAYASGLHSEGVEIRSTRISDMRFDPSLHKGYNEIQTLEPDLVKFQEDVRWCDHFVIVMPLWWGGAPAALKGLIDRAFLPSFAFKFKEGSPFQEKLLKGRTAHVLLTMDAPGFWYRWILGRPWSNTLRRQILGFVGFKPVRISIFGGIHDSKPALRSAYLDKARRLGTADR